MSAEIQNDIEDVPDTDEVQDEPEVQSSDLGQSRGLAERRSHEYTSENYKLSINNIPRNMNKFHMAKNMVEQHLKLTSHRKIKIGRGVIYVTFGSSKDRDEAIEHINKSDYKGGSLRAEVAQPKIDTFLKKQKIDHDVQGDGELDNISDPQNPADINTQVCPLWGKEYEDQLKIKTRAMRKILNMYNQIKKFNNKLAKEAPKLHDWNEKNKVISCQFDGVEASPRLTGYRNKCEFNVDKEGNVGFRLGRYKDGSSRVVHPPKDCPILNETMIEIIRLFEEHLKNGDTCKLTGFDPVTHSGHVRQLTVRTNEKSEALVIIDMDPNDLSDDIINQELQKMVDRLKTLDCIVSIYSNVSTKAHLAGMDQTVKLIFGTEYLNEYMKIGPDNELRFRIGPMSFFQVNTKAAEILYSSIGNLGLLDKKTIVLDIGSGIGTIGLSVAKQVHHVIGIEIIDSAVQDAKCNASANGIENVSFFSGKAEYLIEEALIIAKKRLKEDLNNEGSILAIVDPPRAGFNPSFVKSLRASSVNRLIYVACDPKSNENLLSLCRPRSKAYQGEPFVPVRSKAVDLFPHTKACELVILYQRLDQIVE